MSEFITNIAYHINLFPLWAVFLFVFLSACIQQFFPPYPSEILLLFLGCLAASRLLPGVPVIAIYAFGTVLSSLFVFHLSRRGGKQLLKNKFVMKFFPRKYQLKAGVYVRRYGILALIFCKFLPGVNTLSLIMGGIMGLKGPAAWLSISITGIVANVVYFLAGTIIGNNIPALYHFSKNFSIGAMIAVAVIIAAAAAFYLVGKYMAGRKKKPAASE
ncbi:MAG TPA: VTT domain-containing protein [Clostridia bacterium]|nr:VTT domain-containing protein [Clostridia bacterium]